MNKSDIVDNPIWLFLEGEIKKEQANLMEEFMSLPVEKIDVKPVIMIRGQRQGMQDIIDMVGSWKEKKQPDRQNLT